MRISKSVILTRPVTYMMPAIAALLSLSAMSFCSAAAQELSPVARVLDHELTQLENDLVPLAEAMPEEKYDFAPTEGEFKGVRTFAQQISHTAAAINTASAAMLKETVPQELQGSEYGPSTLKTKLELVSYLKGAIAHARSAMATLTTANLTDEVQAWWGKAPRLFMADLTIWHSYDHYGQLVEYVRMNGIIPPASRPKK